jgi:hypothetical protein
MGMGMRSNPIRIRATFLLLGAAAAPLRAQVLSSEFFANPVSEGWNLIQTICAETWVEDGWYQQGFDPDTCSTGSGAGQDAYVRSITDFNGEPEFFLEFHLQTDGDRSEIPRGAPAGISMANFAGVIYHVTVARDLVKFIGHFDLPGRFFEIEPGLPHTFRIELYPDWYVFYIDGNVTDEGAPDGPFPAHDARITWLGRSWELPAENAWDYIRYGVIPLDGSGDFDSDGVVTPDDFYFFHECLSNRRLGINGGPGMDAGPGCRFADFNDDSSTDLSDFATFQLLFGQAP